MEHIDESCSKLFIRVSSEVSKNPGFLNPPLAFFHLGEHAKNNTFGHFKRDALQVLNFLQCELGRLCLSMRWCKHLVPNGPLIHGHIALAKDVDFGVDTAQQRLAIALIVFPGFLIVNETWRLKGVDDGQDRLVFIRLNGQICRHILAKLFERKLNCSGVKDVCFQTLPLNWLDQILVPLVMLSAVDIGQFARD